MTHARRQMRACALAWRETRNPCDLFAAILWNHRSIYRRIRIPVAQFDAPHFLVPVPGANPRGRV